MLKVTENVELKVPVDETYISVVRLLISGLGTRLGLAVDELENLKLVVGEAFLTIVEKCGKVAGLIHLKWAQDETHIHVALSDPSGKHKSVTNAMNLVLLKNLGGAYKSTVIDGVEHLNIDFDVKYKEDRPFIFNERKGGRA